MEYDISSANGWLEHTPQTGESTLGQATKALVLLSFSSGVCLPVMAYEQTGYETPLSALDASYPLAQPTEQSVVHHTFNAVDATDRIKRVFGLSISRQSQIIGVSRQAVYNWRNGDEPTGNNLEVLTDLSDAAELFENENIEVTGLLMKRPFTQGKSLLDLLANGESIYEPSKKLIAQIKQEAEERTGLAGRLRGRTLPRIDTSIDLE